MTKEITRAEWDRLMKKPGFNPSAYIIEGREPRYKIVEEKGMSSETITFNRMEFNQFVIAQGEEGFATSIPEEVEDPRLALLTDALKNMCDCASAFQGRDSIPAAEFMEKAGPVVANAAQVLGQVQGDD